MCIDYPSKLVAELEKNETLPSRDGVGGAPAALTPGSEDEALLISTLESHAYDLTYRQIETLTGRAAAGR